MSQIGEAEVIFHIGASKCGSTAIQVCLERNAELLRDRGIGVPGQALNFESPVSGEQIWHFEKAANGGGKALGAEMAALLQVADARGLKRLFVSGENICNHPQLAPVLAEALNGRRVGIIFYVRRQDDFLISSWQQWHLKLYDTLEAYLAENVGHLARWYSMIAPWADVFGDASICVRLFDRESLQGGDVVQDFLAQTNIDPQGLDLIKRAENPSYDEAVGRLAHRVRDVFSSPDDNRFYEVMLDLLGKSILKTSGASALLPLDTRHRIVARYASENDALQARFLPDRKRPLFSPTRPEQVMHLSERQQISEDIAMLTRAVYALALRTAEA